MEKGPASTPPAPRDPSPVRGLRLLVDGPAPGLRLLVDGPAPGAWNMAVDEALMGAARDGAVTLRLYRWDPPCLSFGRHQAAGGCWDEAAAAARGIGIVRRPTGGRAVYHDREVTYAVTVPDRLWGGPRTSYLRINRALGLGLSRLGAPVQVASGPAGAGGPPRPDGRGCFVEAAPGEVTALGRKLVGSAVWRRSGALLQHGSVLVHDDQHVVETLRLRPEAGDGRDSRAVAPPGPTGASAGPAGSSGPASASVGLAEACGRVPGVEEIVEAVAAGFAEEFGLVPVPAELSAGEGARARRLVEVYQGREWTWRR